MVYYIYFFILNDFYLDSFNEQKKIVDL